MKFSRDDYEKQFLDFETINANWVYVNSKNVEDFIGECEKLLEKHTFIVLKAVGRHIPDAFALA